MRTFEQAQEEAMPTPQEPPDDFLASCFECGATWESLADLEREFSACGDSDTAVIPHCPRCLHDW